MLPSHEYFILPANKTLSSFSSSVQIFHRKTFISSFYGYNFLSNFGSFKKRILKWILVVKKNLNSIAATPSTLSYIQYQHFPFSCTYSTDILIGCAVVITEVILVKR